MNRQTTTHALALITVLAAGLVPAAPARSDDIRLRASVRLPARAESVRLGDVAELEGTHAQEFADLLLVEVSGSEPIELSVLEVRRLLTEAGAHWGRLNLSGSRVIARPLRSEHAAPPRAMSPASLLDAGSERPRGPRDRQAADESTPAAAVIEEATLRGEVARFLTMHLHTPPPDLRLAFREEDAEALGTSSHDLRFEIEPYGRVRSDIVQLAVRAWREERVQHQWTLRVQPTVRSEVLVTTRNLRRGDRVDASDLDPETRWLSPPAAADAAGTEDIARAVLGGRVEAGRVLTRSHLEMPLVVERGDLVMIRCLVGGLAISLRAEAREDAAAGETIPFRKPRERDTFLATVTGPGEAVVDLSWKRGDEP